MSIRLPLLARLSDAVRVIIGVPSYRLYREHMAHHHPDDAPMSRGEFFDARQQARYSGKGGGRCC
ncbi:CstA-like transporter-associated (seleno)protein [Sphingomonadaceae bacterium OTU29THOMA1]|nr:CstA-like transporter-associated (seleno)protein [Sphingomonadaceae bacterium OTU29THOMA1]